MLKIMLAQSTKAYTTLFRRIAEECVYILINSNDVTSISQMETSANRLKCDML